MSVSGKYDRYDNLVKLVTGSTGEKWPVSRLFLHMLEDTYKNNGNQIRFVAGNYYPEADAYNMMPGGTRESTKQKVKSRRFAAAFEEFLNHQENDKLMPKNLLILIMNLLEKMIELIKIEK